MRSCFLYSFVALLFVVAGYGQTDYAITGNHEVVGVAKTLDGSVISGLFLYVSKGPESRTFETDIDGKFRLKLQSGHYVVTVNKIHSPNFKLFLNIQTDGLNPNNLVLTIDLAKYCCSTSDGRAFPKPESLSMPPYPPAARAIRASGEVIVSTKLRADGSVESASATSGHVLLRSAAIKAARESRFEPGAEGRLREVILTYAFIGYAEKNWMEIKPGIRRYSSPFRITVIGARPELDI
jgi:TonB family protein